MIKEEGKFLKVKNFKDLIDPRNHDLYVSCFLAQKQNILEQHLVMIQLSITQPKQMLKRGLEEVEDVQTATKICSQTAENDMNIKLTIGICEENLKIEREDSNQVNSFGMLCDDKENKPKGKPRKRRADNKVKNSSGNDQDLIVANSCLASKPKSGRKSNGKRSKRVVTIDGKVEEKSYVCPDCQRPFKRVEYLRTHSVVHTKEKPFTCSLCFHHFTQRSSLATHIKNFHGILKKYECECGEKFQYFAELKKHTANNCRLHDIKDIVVGNHQVMDANNIVDGSIDDNGNVIVNGNIVNGTIDNKDNIIVGGDNVATDNC